MKIQNDVRRLLDLVKTNNMKFILDLGCGDASRLIGLKKALGDQINATGYDLAFQDKILSKGRKCGVNLYEGNIEDELPRLFNNSLDLIIMSQMIEHVINPELVLKEINDKLKPGGLLFLETPDLSGLDYFLFKKYFWGGYHIPRHIHLFNQNSLSKLLENNNFFVEDKGSLPSPGFWIISLRNLLGMNSRKFSSSPFEIFNFSSIPIVAFFYLLDKIFIVLRLRTSNQFIISRKPNLV